MDFYSTISHYYDYIFPLNPAHISFIEFFLSENNGDDTKTSRLLDVGCSTGSLALDLAHKKYTVYAIDFDPEMINLARKKKETSAMVQFPVFINMDMRSITDTFRPSSFDLVICFGNTLVHLLSIDDIKKFLQSAYTTLAPNGYLLVQILNYDYILDNLISSLPHIENEHLIFERNYDFTSLPLINFTTRLTIKHDKKHLSNTIQLLPVRKALLETLLLETGFRNIEFYGNFNMGTLTNESLPLVVKAST